MSSSKWFVLGVLILSAIDYLMFDFERKRWGWLLKRTRIQKVGFLISIFLGLFLLNYVTL